MEAVIDFYKKYDEDKRLTVRHNTEFFITTYFLDSLVKGRHLILDVGAGTGLYSLYYAQRGCSVEAMDIVPHHIDILCERILPGMKINALVGDARDLSAYYSDLFDIVLNMGPIYHIQKHEIENCIKESLRVIKPGGYLAMAYVNKYAGYGLDKYADLFKFYSPSEIEGFFNSHKVEIVSHAPTDGHLYQAFDDYLNNYFQSNNNRPVEFADFQQNLTNIEDIHAWLDENCVQNDIYSIKEKFIHALVILKKIA